MKNMTKYIAVIIACLSFPSLAGYNAIVVSHQSYRKKADTSGENLSHYESEDLFVIGQKVYFIVKFDDGKKNVASTHVWFEDRGVDYPLNDCSITYDRVDPAVEPSVWDTSDLTSPETISALAQTDKMSTEVPEVAPVPSNTVHVVKVEFITPDGNPVTAGTGASGTDGQNEFTYDDAGLLTVDLKAKVTADENSEEAAAAIASDILFYIEGIPSTTDAWQPTAENGYLVATAYFSGLPADNDSFGLKTATLSHMGDEFATQDFEIFYPRDATNNPGGVVPNWFYYWVQTTAGYDEAYYNSTLTDYGQVPAMRQWTMSGTLPAKNRIEIGNSAAGSHAAYAIAQTVTGIDLFANTIKHEKVHVQQIKDADALLGVANGWPNSSYVNGWSWNTPSGVNNHVSFGTDSKPGVANVDDDQDGTIDDAAGVPSWGTSEPGWPSTDDIDLDSNDSHWPDAWGTPTMIPGQNPIESQAYLSEDIPQDTHASEDWGSPGKQHENKNYDDSP